MLTENRFVALSVKLYHDICVSGSGVDNARQPTAAGVNMKRHRTLRCSEQKTAVNIGVGLEPLRLAGPEELHQRS